MVSAFVVLAVTEIDPPRETEDPLIVTLLLVREPLPMFDRVLEAPLIVLLVRVSVVALPTRVSVAAGRVSVPEAVAVATRVVVPDVAPAIVNPPDPMAGVVKVLFVSVWLPLKVTTVESIAIVTAPEPLKDDPDKPVPIVRAFVVLAVMVVLPPRDTAFPFTVTLLFANLALAIEPANIVLVTVPVSPVVTKVPVLAGRVSTIPVPATALGISCTDPEVAPGRVTLLIPVRARLAEALFRATEVVPIKVVSARKATVLSTAMVTAPEPLKLVPDKPLPIVKALVVLAVMVVLPPRETDCPLTVTLLFESLALAMLPASIVFVTVPVSPVVIAVPVVAGRVNTVLVPATAAGITWTLPEVAPGRVTLKMPVKFKLAEALLRATDVVPMKVVSDF
jgi:hypothetical protein